MVTFPKGWGFIVEANNVLWNSSLRSLLSDPPSKLASVHRHVDILHEIRLHLGVKRAVGEAMLYIHRLLKID
jgi:hypothetical protein